MNSKIELKDIESFIHVAHAGALSTASRKYGIAKATLSDQIKRLENQLGVMLFHRSPQKLELSETGHEFLHNCQAIISARDNACNLAQNRETHVSGKLNISNGAEFGSSLICPFIIRMKENHPSVVFDVSVRAGKKQFEPEPEVDCYIYLGTPPDPIMVGQLLGKFTYRLYASPDYLERSGTPASPRDLTNHRLITTIINGKTEHWGLNNKKQSADIDPGSAVVADSYWLSKFFAVDGLGLSFLPEFFVHHEVRDQLLSPVLKPWKSTGIPLYALYPEQHRNNRKLSTFIECCRTELAEITRSPPPYTTVKL